MACDTRALPLRRNLEILDFTFLDDADNGGGQSSLAATIRRRYAFHGDAGRQQE